MREITRKTVSLRKVGILGLLAAPASSGRVRQPIRGRTRLQKLLFLVQNRVRDDFGPDDAVFRFDYKYEREKFGPADIELYQDLEFLQSMRLISIDGKAGIEEVHEPTVGDITSLPQGEAVLPEEDEEDELSFEYLMGRRPEEYLQAEAEDAEIESVYEMTTEGLSMLDSIRGGLPDDRNRQRFDGVIAACDEVRGHYADWPLKRLLRFIYKEHEDYTTRSIIRPKVLGKF